MIKRLFSAFVLFFGLQSFAQVSVRWTGSEDSNSEFPHLIEVINQKTGSHVSASDFLLIEDRELATSHFRFYEQTLAGVPIAHRSVRVWSDLKTGQSLQVEANLESDQQIQALHRRRLLVLPKKEALTQPELQLKVRKLVEHFLRHTEDPLVREMKIKDAWKNGDLVRSVKVKSKHGWHLFDISIPRLKITAHKYVEFPNADPVGTADQEDEFSIPAKVYPIYEEAGFMQIQNRVVTQLKHLKKNVRRPSTDLYTSLRDRRYLSDKNDPILGVTADGQAQGYWTMSDIKERAMHLRDTLPFSENSFAQGGVSLEGRYGTVSIMPEALTAFPGVNFTPLHSSAFKPTWKPVQERDLVYEMIPTSGYFGRPLASFDEAYQRPARRLPDHSPQAYLNDGFDEIQVYYALTTLVESLHTMGFTDPELSTRPFHAFLYDPDISSKDNAYYEDDTINFATYSPDNGNAARDNYVIWHELGHGIMDRLMGDSLVLADTGGLSEGMADFVAQLVIEKVTKGIPFPGSDHFRIINSIGFSLTNEVHDDGEAYGGSMRDLLMAARTVYGEAGVTKIGDLTLEAMRLCRHHPALTAEDWFNHLLFADELGHEPVRAKGELRSLILTSLNGRNFTFDGQGRAQFQILNNGQDVVAGSDGSREKPVRVTLAPDQKQTYSLEIKVQDGVAYKFQYPMTVKVKLQGGPLQGAIHWEGEEAPKEFVIHSAEESVKLDLTATGTCDFSNRPDGSCQDFAYIQLWPAGSTSPVAKKRFYLRVTH